MKTISFSLSKIISFYPVNVWIRFTTHLLLSFLIVKRKLRICYLTFILIFKFKLQYLSYENIHVENCYSITKDYFQDVCRFYKREYRDTFCCLNVKLKSAKQSNTQTPVIDASIFHTGKSNKIKVKT